MPLRLGLAWLGLVTGVEVDRWGIDGLGFV